VLEFLTRGRSAQPMVMLFDDLHWADEPAGRVYGTYARPNGFNPTVTSVK
jgi:hypothetical protein